MLDTPCSEELWRVLATHSVRQFPLHFPFRASPCTITFQLDSTTNSQQPNNPLRTIQIQVVMTFGQSIVVSGSWPNFYPGLVTKGVTFLERLNTWKNVSVECSSISERSLKGSPARPSDKHNVPRRTGGMVGRGENLIAERKPRPSTTLHAMNLTWRDRDRMWGSDVRDEPNYLRPLKTKIH